MLAKQSKWTVSVAVSVGLGVTAQGLLAAAPAAADGNTHHVFRTDGDGVWLHSEPSIHDGLLQILPEGAEFVPECYELSDEVFGNPVWLYGHSGSTYGFVTDYYIDTHWSTLADLEAQGITSCDGSGGPATFSEGEPSVLAPVDIQLYVDGTRERNLQAMSDELQAAADGAGVSGQELARVIYHEGGNYLGGQAREDVFQERDRLLPFESVGIGQITADTARLVEEEVYGNDLSSETDATIQDWLIYDQSYALSIAAGKLRLLRDLGLGEGWPQFMAYSMPEDKALNWKLAGHPMDTASLDSLELDPGVIQARQQHYNDTINAIG